MKKTFLALVFLSLGCIQSCAVIEALLSDDENCVSTCDRFEPDEGIVTIYVTINQLNPRVWVEIFEGDLEHDRVIESRIVGAEKWRLSLPNGDYSVRATYKAILNGDDAIIYSVDGDCLTPEPYSECGDICYREGRIDLDATLISIKPYFTGI